MATPTILEAALSYYSKGISIFPVGKDKRPLIPSWIEFQKRKATEEEILAWWKKWPDANVAIVTGEISGLTVVDCDLGSDHTIFPATLTAQTGSGGYHLYYKYYPIGNKAAILPHVDIRGDGGYVVAPPSITDDSEKKKGGEYKVVKKRTLAPFPVHIFSGERPKSKLDIIIAEGSDDGSRNNDLAVFAGSLLARYPEREWQTKVWPMLVSWNATKVRPPKGERELATIFKSIASAEKSKRLKCSVGEIAVENIGDTVRATLPIDGGFAVFEFTDFNFSARSQECTLLCHIEEAAGKTRVLTSRLNLLSMSNRAEFLRQFKDSFEVGKKSPWPALLSEIFTLVAQNKVAKYRAERFKDIQVQPWSYLMEPFVVKNAPNALFAKGGSGKTFFALRIGLSVAFGLPLASCPQPTDPTNVMFLDFEDDSGEFKDRITKMVRGLPPGTPQPTEEQLNERLFYFDSKGLPFVNLVDPLKRAVTEHNIGLLIIDSAAKACGGSAESSEDTNNFFNALRSVNVTSLIIAHESKNAQEDNDDIFGSSFWNNSFRNVWKLKTDREKDDDFMNTALIHCKSNRGKLQKTRAYRIKFGPDFVEMNHADVAEVFAKEMPLETQVTNAIFQDYTTTKAIAEYIGKDVNTARTVLHRLVRKRHVLKDPRSGKETNWILPSQISGDKPYRD